MKPTLQFRLSQHLTLTPQLQQSIRLLQLSTVELNQEIERLLADNPILEREDGESDAATAQVVATQEAAARASGEEPRERTESGAEGGSAFDLRADFAAPWRGGDEDGDDGDRTHAAPDNPTLRDHLNGQLALTNLGARDRALVALLIDALDEDGDRKSTRLNSSHIQKSRMPSSA